MSDTAIHTDDPILTVQELADYIKVSVRTIYNWRAQGLGPKSVGPRRLARYRKSDIDRWLAKAR